MFPKQTITGQEVEGGSLFDEGMLVELPFGMVKEIRPGMPKCKINPQTPIKI